MVNPTIVLFSVKRKRLVNWEKKLTELYDHPILCCYTGKTDNEIHDQLTGWDYNYDLKKVIRLTGPIDTNFLFNPATEHPVTVVFYNVMNTPFTEVFYDKSDLEIKELIEQNDFQSYQITTVIHSETFKYDSLNSITRFKDTN